MRNTLILAAVSVLLAGCGSSGDGSGDLQAGETGVDVVTAISIIVPATYVSGEVVTFTADGDSDGASYEWTLIGQPEGSAPLFIDYGASTAQVVRTAPGDYTMQLIVSEGDAISEPATATTTVVFSPNAISRELVRAEQDELISEAIEIVKAQLRSPSSFALVSGTDNAVRFTSSEPESGGVGFDFDAQNGFGVAIRYEAICGIDWNSSGYWRITLQPDLTRCWIY